jgi:hypothetical protein
VRFLAVFLLVHFVISLSIMWSPMIAQPKTFFTLNVSAFMFSLTFAVRSSAAKAIPGFIFAFGMFALFFPAPVERLFGGIEKFNEPRLLPIVRGAIARDEVRFYVKGEPKVWYCVTREEKYELWDSPGYSDVSRTPLRPITDSVIEILKANEDLISPRNFVKDNTPPSAPPGSKSPLNFSGNCNLRWIMPPGYPGYERGSDSGWISGHLAMTETSMSIDLFYSDGRKMARFDGTRSGNGPFSGNWTMIGLSGDGPFTLPPPEGNASEGTLVDQTVDPRPITLKLWL